MEKQNDFLYEGEVFSKRNSENGGFLKQRDRTKGILCCTEENVDRCVLECAKWISCASNQRYMISLFLIVRMVNIDSLLCIRTSNVA